MTVVQDLRPHILLNIKHACKWDPIHLKICALYVTNLFKFLYNSGLMVAVMAETSDQ
jgi:hypothetical protein